LLYKQELKMQYLKELYGCGTALVTPFQANGQIDEDSLRRLVDYQIENGIDFLVPCGTTGESTTLTEEEHLRVVKIVMQQADGKVPVVAGAGGNNTSKVIELAKGVADLGVYGILSVTPYYNKPTQDGLMAHYEAIAKSVDTAIIIYNVPGRTSVNILPDTVVKLSDLKNIVAIKEASGNIGQISELAVKVPENFIILSGDDIATIPILSLGGRGLISVVANEVPFLMTKLVHLCLESKYDEAQKIQHKIFKLMTLNFIETNPIPVKAALSLMGLMKDTYRLPLIKIKEKNKQLLKEELIKLNLVNSY
jgi:4-hydroxy-tetrahydrodipicolinate synthase